MGLAAGLPGWAALLLLAGVSLLLGFILPHGRTGMIALGAFFALTGLFMPAIADCSCRPSPAAED